MISARNIDEAIFELKLFLKIADKYAGEIVYEITKAISKFIPDIDGYLYFGNPGKLFFESEDFEFRCHGGDDLEANFKPLSELITEVFPQLEGMVYDDRIFLNRRLQSKIRRSLKELKNG